MRKLAEWLPAAPEPEVPDDGASWRGESKARMLSEEADDDDECACIKWASLSAGTGGGAARVVDDDEDEDDDEEEDEAEEDEEAAVFGRKKSGFLEATPAFNSEALKRICREAVPFLEEEPLLAGSP